MSLTAQVMIEVLREKGFKVSTDGTNLWISAPLKLGKAVDLIKQRLKEQREVD